MKKNLAFVISIMIVMTTLTSCEKEEINVISGPSQKIMDLMGGHVVTGIDSTTREFIHLMDECRALYSGIPARFDSRLRDIIVPGKPVDGYYVLNRGQKWYPHVVTWEQTIESPMELFSRVDARMEEDPNYLGYREITGKYNHPEQRYLSFDVYYVQMKICQSGCQTGNYKCLFYEMIFLPECYIDD